MRRLSVSLVSLVSLCALLCALVSTRAAYARSPSKHPGRSLAVADSNGTALMLEEMRRADKRRRDDILRLEMEAQRRERSDRVVIFGVVAIAAVAVIFVEKRRRIFARR